MATAGEDDDEDGYSLKEEIEMLEAIYIHELTIKGRKDRPSSISLLLHPSTGEEDDKKYVCLTLEIILTNEYPNELPSIKIRNPRGLSEAHIESISDNLHGLTESLLGCPMLYQIIDYAKESLTDNNIPSCTCAICLGHFQDHDCFTKTDCYHYFHCHCLLRYIDYHLNHCDENSDDSSAQQIICPMCREPITYDLDALKSAPDLDDNEEKIVYHADAEMKRLQREMSKLYNQQLQKGAIINVEEEKNKAVISLNMESSSPPISSSIEKPVVSEIPNPVSSNSSMSSSSLVESKGTEREGKSRVDRPSSSRKNRGRGGHRPWSEGRRSDRSDDRWIGQAKGFEKKRDVNKQFYRGGTSRRRTADRNGKDNNKTLGSEEVSKKNREIEPQRLKENSHVEKGEQTRPEKGALPSSPIDNTKRRNTNTLSTSNEIENNTSTYREHTKKADNSNNKLNSNEKDAPSETSRALSHQDRLDRTHSESLSKKQAEVVESSQKGKTRPKRDNYKSYSKESKVVDKQKYPKSSYKRSEQSKSRPGSSPVAPPPGFEAFDNKSGGRRPPPGFENNSDSSIPKPPGF